MEPRKNKNKRKKLPLGIIIIFFVGLSVMIYPLISRTYYNFRSYEEIDSYSEEVDQLQSDEMLERFQLAQAYNQALLSGEMTPLSDPFSDEEMGEGVAAYAEALELKEKLGVLTIPKINSVLPIYAGTSEAVLQKGVGHIEGTSLPIGGVDTHSVLTAHRGLPENKLFTDLNKMELGDLFFLETIAGKLTYEVVEIKVIEPTDFDSLTIDNNRDLVTLLTCTPYMINSHRLLVIGERIELIEEVKEEVVTAPWWMTLFNVVSEYSWLIMVNVVFLLLRTGWKILRA